jgi:hypothetical protein
VTVTYDKKLDYQRHCLIPQFDYVRANDEPNTINIQELRTLDWIDLRPLSNTQRE